MLDPKRISVQVALRSGQLQGVSQTALEISYQQGYLAVDGNKVPASASRDAVLAVEAELAEIIANDKVNPYRNLLYGRSVNLPTRSVIPSVSNGTELSQDEGSGSGSEEAEPIPFIGVFSEINDSADHTPLTEQTVQAMRRYARGSYQTNIYHYAMLPGRILHTRQNVYFEGCIFSRTRAEARFATDSAELSPMPTSLESTWVARSIEFLVQQGYLFAEAEFYSKFAQSGIARLKARALDLPVLPSQQATSKPGVN